MTYRRFGTQKTTISQHSSANSTGVRLSSPIFVPCSELHPSPSGHLVYISKGTLFAVPFDQSRLEVKGSPTAVLDEVAYSEAYGSAQIDFSRTGTVVYRESRLSAGLVTMQWVDESGNTIPVLPVPGNYLSPALSADGTRLAFTLSGDVWVYDLKHPAMVRLTFGGGFGNPLWTTDSRRLVFRGAGGIFWIDAAGTGRPEPLIDSKQELVASVVLHT